MLNLEERLIDYAVFILDTVEALPNDRGANHLASQLVRSGTGPALLYGEAQGAESRKDFIHKMKVALKELRESFNCLKIIHRKKYISHQEQKLLKALQESDELISIFVKSIGTAMKNLKAEA
ncbi:MAG TPA: four helix bundle protein [Ohtaekwangia sp.]|uniref:four helix bundle protein n=1 Tax=Ohtaekwangia sp. TaxID=2066019 RepID=UPI002F957DA2